MQDLVKRVTGAKYAFVTISVLRTSSTSEGEAIDRKATTAVDHRSTLPLSGTDTKDVANRTYKPSVDSSTRPSFQAPIHIPSTDGGSPARTPHLDHTPFGARQVICSWRRDINSVSVESGIIAAEDDICHEHPFKATDKESDSVIAEKSNQNGTGPQYTAYSLWRPLSKVRRDPLTRLSRREFDEARARNPTLVYYPCSIRVPAHPELGGDFLRELVQLRVNPVRRRQHSAAVGETAKEGNGHFTEVLTFRVWGWEKLDKVLK